METKSRKTCEEKSSGHGFAHGSIFGKIWRSWYGNKI